MPISPIKLTYQRGDRGTEIAAILARTGIEQRQRLGHLSKYQGLQRPKVRRRVQGIRKINTTWRYMEERYTKQETYADGSSKTEIRIISTSTGAMEFCLIITCLCVMLSTLYLVLRNDPRRLSPASQAPQTLVRTDTRQGN